MPLLTQHEKAAKLRQLHDRSRILLLPNAWDVASARVFEAAGFPAIATTSGGVAATLGYPDGQRVSRGEMLDVVRRIAGAVNVPVTADMEAGYGDDPASAADTVRGVLSAGAVGLNLEDGTGNPSEPLRPPKLQVERIRAARIEAQEAEIPVVINARVDVYLHPGEDEATRFRDAVDRANAYREAGADSLFLIGARDPGLIARLVSAIHGPVNVLAGPGFPPIDELERIGVARVSFGSGPMRAALTAARRFADEILRSGTYESLAGEIITHPELNRLMDG